MLQTDETIRFVERFEAAWAAPDPDRLAELLHRDARLHQPLAPPVVGRDGARRHFAELMELLDGLRGEVLSWAAREDVVLVELRLSGRLGGRPLVLTGVDRIVLEDGLIRERVFHFDPLPLAAALLRRPQSLLRLLKRPTLRPRF